MAPKPAITILTDNVTSWMVPYAREIADSLSDRGFQSRHITSHSEILAGDILFLLSCEKKLPATLWSLHSFNIVIHESDLPAGRGWSPVTWQVLDGRSEIVVCAVGISEVIDGGPIYARGKIRLEGHELIDEIRLYQSRVTKDLCIELAEKYPRLVGEPQIGRPTYFSKRTHADSQLDVSKPLIEQFALMRVADNARYPLWFELHGHRYQLCISKGNLPHD